MAYGDCRKQPKQFRAERERNCKTRNSQKWDCSDRSEKLEIQMMTETTTRRAQQQQLNRIGRCQCTHKKNEIAIFMLIISSSSSSLACGAVRYFRDAGLDSLIGLDFFCTFHASLVHLTRECVVLAVSNHRLECSIETFPCPTILPSIIHVHGLSYNKNFQTACN